MEDVSIAGLQIVHPSRSDKGGWDCTPYLGTGS